LDPHARLPIVLIVEDTPEHAAVIQAALSYRAVQAVFRVVTSGEEAMSYLEGEWPYEDRHRDPLPALVVLDHWLPAVSGLEVLEWLRSHEVHAQMPVVVFTASHDVAHEAKARSLGVHAFKVKPEDFGELADTVQVVLQEVIHSGVFREIPESGAG
jgi:DNA-binding response OmpR family regulator